MSRRGRRLALFLPVLVTILLGAVVGALVVVQHQEQSDEVAVADAAAESYLADVDAFRSEISREVRGARTADPRDLRRVLKKAVADPPRLTAVQGAGAQRSASYTAARETEAALLDPYRRLDRALKDADLAQTFIEEAREVLALRATDHVGSTTLSDSGPIRSRLIPAFTAARDRFASVRVPRGQEQLARTVRGAVQHVIDQATILATSIEANRSFSFTYSEQFQAAAEAVDGYAAVVDGDVKEAISAVVAPS
jgi:flagellar basal body-associated protein FliL